MPPAPDTMVCLDALKQACRHVIRFLGTSQGMLRIALSEGQFHTGDDPIVADLDTQVEFVNSLEQHPAYPLLRIWGVVGEENIVAPLDEYEPGTRVIVVDPLDGSTTWAMARQAYCVAAMSMMANSAGKLELECATIATPVHLFTYVHPGELRFGPTISSDPLKGGPYDYLLQTAVPETAVRHRSLALNGYKSRDRRMVLELMRQLRDWDIVTMAGNPFTPYVIIGNLTAALNTRAQCTWDALGILMCTSTDVVVGDATGTLVSGSAFQLMFNKVAVNGNVKLIPPMIVAKNMEAYKALARVTEDVIRVIGFPDFE